MNKAHFKITDMTWMITALIPPGGPQWIRDRDSIETSTITEIISMETDIQRMGIGPETNAPTTATGRGLTDVTRVIPITDTEGIILIVIELRDMNLKNSFILTTGGIPNIGDILVGKARIVTVITDMKTIKGEIEISIGIRDRMGIENGGKVSLGMIGIIKGIQRIGYKEASMTLMECRPGNHQSTEILNKLKAKKVKGQESNTNLKGRTSPFIKRQMLKNWKKMYMIRFQPWIKV